MACLVWESPRGRVVLTLERAVAVLGSDPVADLCIDDPSVAGRHALIQVENERVRITDLGTKTQTRINGAALVPDVPSTIEPGDFVTLGKVVVNFLKTPPPAVAAAPAPKAPPRPARAPPARRPAPPPPAAPAPRRELPWKWIAIGLAFLVVALGGAFVGIQFAGRRETPAPPPTVADTPPRRAEPEPEPRPPPAPEPAPELAPAPEPKGPERAPAGTAPAAAFAPVDRCPDLVELDGTVFAPVRVVDWNAARVEALGGDGRLYAIPRARVTKIEDRADLERRARALRARLDPEDAGARLELASWCALRHVRSEARRLVGEVLALRPGDAAALALKATLEGD